MSRSEASYSVQLSVLICFMDESDTLDDARLYDELPVDGGWAADSDSADSGEEEFDEGLESAFFSVET